MTPMPIARQMCDRIVREVSQWRVLDPACGDGNLLLAAIERLQAANIPEIHKRIVGVDIDPVMVGATRLRLAAAMGCHPEQVRVVCADFLELAHTPLLSGQLFSDPTVIISNPPYGKNREYEFLTVCNDIFARGAELVFLMPLAFLDRATEAAAGVLEGKPLGVTTGHCIYHHVCGHGIHLQSTRRKRSGESAFSVHSGVKLYEVGAGSPPQTERIISEKPFSSPRSKSGWLPCLRTGDIEPYRIRVGRLFIDYGPHLAHPKEIQRFTGPRLFVRRVPMWGSRTLASAFTEETAVCAGDVLVVRHKADDVELLKGLSVFINSPRAATAVLGHRPSVQHRVSFPKIAAKDLEWLFETDLPTDDELRRLSSSYSQFRKPSRTYPTKRPSNISQRLIETGFPLEEVSQAAGREKSIRQGHISTLQMWWARRPMGVCRAALFAALCPCAEDIEKDPRRLDMLSAVPGETTDEKLQRICAGLADWQAGSEGDILEVAKSLIAPDRGDAPFVVDTFAGGGSIPIEATRLGLQSFAGDLNPVAVTALKLALQLLPGASSDTLSVYGEMGRKISHSLKEVATTLYGDTKKVQHLAFFWCKTVTCPRCDRQLPLLKDKWLAKGKRQYAVRIAHGRSLRFDVYCPSTDRERSDADSGNVSAGGALCPWCDFNLSTASLAELSRAGQMTETLYAKFVIEGGEKTYKEITAHDKHLAEQSVLRRKRDRRVAKVPDVALDMNGIRHTWAMQYGVRNTRDLYSRRQQVALLELLYEIERELSPDRYRQQDVYSIMLALTFNRVVMYGTRHAWWQANGEFPANMYVRQGIPMVWNYVEVPISTLTGGGWRSACTWIRKVAEHLVALPQTGTAWLGDAAATPLQSQSADLVAIDPPYFDSITYAYLADPFYVWMRLLLGQGFPDEFSQELTPKDDEAIVDRPHKLAPNPKGEGHFRRKMEEAFREAARVLRPGGRLLLMYGHKKLRAWDAILSALLDSGFVPTVSWPIQMERKVKFRHGHIDALASSCIIFCERSDRTEKLDTSWQEVEAELKANIRRALYRYQRANFMGADLASALIAPACALLHKYTIRNEDGRAWSVSELLEKLPRIAEECEVETIQERGSEDAGEIITALRSISPKNLVANGLKRGWTSYADMHSGLLLAAQYAEALYSGDKVGADNIWDRLSNTERKTLCTALRAAAVISPPGSLGRQLAHAGLGRASMLLRVN